MNRRLGQSGAGDGPFKIGVAQIASLMGDIKGNVDMHAAAMNAAATFGASVLVFPELSLTGYEPELAASLAMSLTDPRLAPLADLARRHRIDTVLGAPLSAGFEKPSLGAIVITRDGARMSYRKIHLGAEEQAYFSMGQNPLVLDLSDHSIGIAICADSSQPAHPKAYAALGVDIYATSVFLNEEWYQEDAPRLAGYARRFGMLTLMANHGASTGRFASVGRSAIWSPDGALLAQASGIESVLIVAGTVDGVWSAETQAL